jgi:hypothetical protein
MKYIITARCWGSEHTQRFGAFGSIHDLSDTEVVQAIIKFGRAEIDTAPLFLDRKDIPIEIEVRGLEFENEYD